MYSLIVENDRKEQLELSSSDSYTVYNIEGLNPPAVSIASSTNGTYDGIAINSQRVDQRNLVIYMTINNDVELNRNKLYKYFPLKRLTRLYFKNGARDVFIEGYVETLEVNPFTNPQIAQISLICPKPYFKAIEDIVSYFSDISPMFEFPFSIEAEGVEISTITHNIRKSIVNSGDIDTGVIIELVAMSTVVNPIIYNADTGGKIAFNFTMQESDIITINTNIGEKGITLLRNGVTTNALGYVNADLEWFTLVAGDNLFTYDCESGNESLQLNFRFTPQYGGV